MPLNFCGNIYHSNDNPIQYGLTAIFCQFYATVKIYSIFDIVHIARDLSLRARLWVQELLMAISLLYYGTIAFNTDVSHFRNLTLQLATC